LNDQDTHRDIVEACQQGRRQAQFELYRLYAKPMYNVCLRMVRDELDAEDVLQNAFADVFTKIASFRFESSVGAWIKRVVINACINFLKRRRLPLETFEEWHNSLIENEEETDFENKGLEVDKVKKAIQDLPDGYRVVFSLYALEGYDHQEIAEVLGVSEATSKSQYSRARRRLKELLYAQPSDK
jgi:RNA polymerase sigma factor (sigma-70 family)